jgi:uncharacterized protein (TIGR03435 family)
MKWSGGILTLENYSLRGIIREAWHVTDYQISAPGGLDPQLYTIVARASHNTTEEQAMLMARLLLEDRFKLRVHFEQRDLQGYALVVGRLGVKLPPARKPGQKEGEIAVSSGARGRISRPGLTIAQLAELLAEHLGRPVSDQTGISGKFAINLEWTPDETEPELAGPPSKARGGEAPPIGDKASVFTAIQEHLGLRLEAMKVPVQVLVVDHAEKASEN